MSSLTGIRGQLHVYMSDRFILSVRTLLNATAPGPSFVLLLFTLKSIMWRGLGHHGMFQIYSENVNVKI